MTAKQFRQLALRLPGVVESAHFNHPDFRVRNRIFATLGYPDERWGMIKLTPDQQTTILRAEPDTFRPAAGAWGRSGSTVVLLAATTGKKVRPLLQQAWANVAARKAFSLGPRQARAIEELRQQERADARARIGRHRGRVAAAVEAGEIEPRIRAPIVHHEIPETQKEDDERLGVCRHHA